MYIWIGCKLPEAFAQQLRAHCLSIPGIDRMDFSGFTLPQHISLKISFQAEDKYREILAFLAGLLGSTARFSVSPAAVECYGRILWLSFSEHARLRQLHTLLDKQLQGIFGIPQHLFDTDFRFHSTLCTGEEAHIRQMLPYFAHFPLPETLPIDTFLLGVSETGISGSFRVVHEVKV